MSSGGNVKIDIGPAQSGATYYGSITGNAGLSLRQVIIQVTSETTYNVYF